MASQPSSTTASTPYRILTSALTSSDFKTHAHPFNQACKRSTFPLGDTCGLSKMGVHLCKVEPGTTSVTLHWHSQEEEWCYILEAGEGGATLLTLTEGEGEPKEEKVVKGDFLAFPANTPTAHALRAGNEELVYLCAGAREPLDVCTYPMEQKKAVLDRSKWRGVSFPGIAGFFMDAKAATSYEYIP